MNFKHMVTMKNFFTNEVASVEVLTVNNTLEEVRQAIYSQYSMIMFIESVKLIWQDDF